ncbi:hypothetical protein [Maribacter aestuarii]|uniref:hypothetical protein n=1 Tax=Maribacter aestuarii TaxID=1130723 RepID=UPI00248C908E|nr:hypothetical protein [Maribacter aestuarii]
MKNNLLLGCLLLSLTGGITFAQVSQSTSDIASQATTCGDMQALFTNSGQSMHNLLYSNLDVTASAQSIAAQNIKGSPFLVDNFEKSTIYVNDQLLGSFYSRYNAFNQEIEIKKTDLAEEQYKALRKDENIKVVFNDKVIEYSSFVDEKGKVTQDYLVSVLSGPNYNLYQRYMINFVEGKPAENSMVSDIPSRFTNATEYYLKDSNSNLVSYVPSKKSEILELFDTNERIQIAALIKKKRLNLKKESSLLEIMNFANSISSDYASKENK